MNDQDKAKQELIEELADLRQRVAEQEAQLTRSRQAKADQRQINNSLPVLVATAGVDGYYKEVNAAFERILGWSEEESLSRPFLEFIHPEDQAIAVETFGRLKSGDAVIDFVDRNVCKDGSHRWINWTVIPLPDRGVVFGIGQDITEKKLADGNREKAEEALREARDELEQRVKERTADLTDANGKLITTLESITDGFISLDHQWRYTYVNQTAASLLDATPDELLGKALWDVYPEAQRLTFFPEFHRALEEMTPVHFEEFYPEPLNKWYECHGYPSSGGLAVYFRDVSERRQVEETLRQSEAKYKALVESSPDAVIMTNLEGRITFASQQAAEQHRVDDPEEMIDRPVFEFVSDEESDRLRKHVRLLLEQGVRKNDEYMCLRADGTQYPTETASAVIRDSAEVPIALMAICRDITERKKAQCALQRERDALNRMLQASDHDRELINYEIHDGVVQQLLGASMFFEAYSKTNYDVPDKAKARFDAGLTALRRAYSEARSLMDRTRTSVLGKFGVKSAIADFIDQLSERPDAPEITYRCEAQFERLEPVLENTILRVVQEAIANACIHSKSEIVRVSLRQEDQDVIIEVEDNGVGFDTANVKQDRFGLDGIRERTRLLGKDLQIESTAGLGTRIRATFALVYRDEQAEGE